MGGGRDEEALGEVLRADEEFMRIVHAVADVNPPHWAVGAGVVRDIVWDRLHGYAIPTRHRDVDVAYFDPMDLSPEFDRRVTGELVRRLPNIVWDAKNQAAVHTWYEARFGAAVGPLTSVEDAVGTWPETATAVVIRSVRTMSFRSSLPAGSRTCSRCSCGETLAAPHWSSSVDGRPTSASPRDGRMSR
jgi:hypothetical protein